MMAALADALDHMPDDSGVDVDGIRRKIIGVKEELAKPQPDASKLRTRLMDIPTTIQTVAALTEVYLILEPFVSSLFS
jgi:hypothetical protein